MKDKDFKTIETLRSTVEKEFTKKLQHYYTTLYHKRYERGRVILIIDEDRSVDVNDSLLGKYTLIWQSNREFEDQLGYVLHSRSIYTDSVPQELVDDMFRFIKGVQDTAMSLD